MKRNFVQLSLPVLFLSTAVNAQSNYASLSGTISDPQQKVLDGCNVQLASISTGASRQAVTNEQGVFQITGLLPGDNNLTVQAPGFATINQKRRRRTTLISNSIRDSPATFVALL